MFGFVLFLFASIGSSAVLGASIDRATQERKRQKSIRPFVWTVIELLKEDADEWTILPNRAQHPDGCVLEILTDEIRIILPIQVFPNNAENQLLRRAIEEMAACRIQHNGIRRLTNGSRHIGNSEDVFAMGRDTP
jgi:hypothetical protein